MCYNVNVDCRFGDRVQILVSQLISLCTNINQMANVNKCEKDKTMIKKRLRVIHWNLNIYLRCEIKINLISGSTIWITLYACCLYPKIIPAAYTHRNRISFLVHSERAHNTHTHTSLLGFLLLSFHHMCIVYAHISTFFKCTHCMLDKKKERLAASHLAHLLRSQCFNRQTYRAMLYVCVCMCVRLYIR